MLCLNFTNNRTNEYKIIPSLFKFSIMSIQLISKESLRKLNKKFDLWNKTIMSYKPKMCLIC